VVVVLDMSADNDLFSSRDEIESTKKINKTPDEKKKKNGKKRKSHFVPNAIVYGACTYPSSVTQSYTTAPTMDTLFTNVYALYAKAV
jgi:hypothetical protein